jgi:hypothetical protein
VAEDSRQGCKGLKRAVISKGHDEKAPMCSGSLGRGARGEHCRGCSGMWAWWSSADSKNAWMSRERWPCEHEIQRRSCVADEPEREERERRRENAERREVHAREATRIRDDRGRLRTRRNQTGLHSNLARSPVPAPRCSRRGGNFYGSSLCVLLDQLSSAGFQR